jgi:S-adenosylmethionine decarboxylase
MIKTCGTTTLLKCIPKLLEFANELELSVELVMYSRKNFLFPNRQMFPHLHWNDEVDYLNKMFEGSAYVFGPMTKDHWFLYLADYSNGAKVNEGSNEATLEIMMHDLDRTVAAGFYRREGISDDEKFPGIADLLPGSETDEFNFSPCGYSMNGLLDEAFWTIHVTPEPHCSYASFETNVRLPSFTKLIASVTEFFKPGSFTVYIFNENGKNDSEFLRQRHMDFEVSGYSLQHKTFSEVDGSCDVTLCNYKSVTAAVPIKTKKPPPLPPQLLGASRLEDSD